MKHFKFLSMMLMAIVAMFAFTACGDDDDSGKTGEVDAWNAVKQTYESVGSAKFSAWQVSVAWFF